MVASYYDKIHPVSWARRTAGFMAGATLGVLYGGAAGLIAAFLPALFDTLGIGSGSPPGIGQVARNMGVFASAGGFLGIGAVGLVGAESGAVAAGFEEKERRETRAAAKTVEPAPGIEPEPKPGNLFSWRVSAVTVPLFAGFGALIASYADAWGGPHLLGFAPGSAAGITASASLFGMFGGIIGIKNSYLTNEVSNFYMKVITDKLFAPEPAQSIEAAPPEPVRAEDRAPEPAPSRNRAFSTQVKAFSLHSIIEHADGGENQIQR